jgi:hypothetical protein
MKGSAARDLFSPSNFRSRLEQEQKDKEPAANGEEPGADGVVPDKVDPLPRPGDAYKVHGRHGNKPDLTIHFVTKDFAYKGFSYGNLEQVGLAPGEKPGASPVMILRFNGSVLMEVTIEGRHLHGLYNWIGLHRVPWVWEHPSPAEFTDEKATLISRITIQPIER